MELLSENGIPYEIVPGVTSPISVPAYNGIPVTHRDFCSSLHIITGHKRAGQEYDIDFKALTDKGNIGVSNGNCSTGGYLQRTSCRRHGPGYAGSSSSERNNSRTEAGGCYCRYPQGRGGQTGIETPAIIVVGKVCSLADKFAWYEKLPLAGWKVLVTRPRQHISKTADLLRQKGAEVLELRLSVQYLLRIMADCMRHLRNWILISGSFLQALQVWRSFLTRWTERDGCAQPGTGEDRSDR